MAKQQHKANGADGKQIIYMRVATTIVTALDKMCGAMELKPTRAQLINAALSEYVRRHSPKNQNRRLKPSK